MRLPSAFRPGWVLLRLWQRCSVSWHCSVQRAMRPVQALPCARVYQRSLSITNARKPTASKGLGSMRSPNPIRVRCVLPTGFHICLRWHARQGLRRGIPAPANCPEGVACRHGRPCAAADAGEDVSCRISATPLSTNLLLLVAACGNQSSVLEDSSFTHMPAARHPA